MASIIIDEANVIRLGIVPPWQVEPLRYITEGLTEPGDAAGVQPEDVNAWIFLPDSVAVFACNLRLADPSNPGQCHMPMGLEASAKSRPV
jgi:hypothetical protein